ncbi:MAG: hypothetical protein AAF465_08675 [Pseudomonadota bacterium]
MVKNALVFSVSGMLALAFAAVGYAEITGSGFRHADCGGKLNITVFHDRNDNGIHERDEEGFPKAELFLSMTHYAELGAEKFVTNNKGFVQVDFLCEGRYSMEVDPESLPPGAVFTGMYEAGELIVDAPAGTISVLLSKGTGKLEPGTLNLDVAFTSLTRGGRY